MSLRSSWRRFTNWVRENTSKPLSDALPPEVPTTWESGEGAAKADEVEAGAKFATILVDLAAGYLDAKAGLSGGPSPTQDQVTETAGEIEAGIKWLAVIVVVGLLVKKIFG